MKQKILIRLPVTLLFVTLFYQSSAQLIIRGQVQDTALEPLPLANVLLLHASDSSFVGGTVSDLQGHFELDLAEAGDYLIYSLMIGYQAAHVPVRVDQELMSTQFLTVTLSEEIRQLNEVVVQGERSFYEKQADRMVVNVQSSTTAAGKSVLEILAKSPGVVVNRQSNSVSLYGKNGVQVMVNGKVSRLPLSAVVQMLDGMSAANVEKIELITSPPAKYDAEGNAGLINIVTVENEGVGTNGTLSLTAGHNQGPTGGVGLVANHHRKQFDIFADYSVLSDKNHMRWVDQRRIAHGSFTQTIVNNQARYPITNIHNLRTGLEYSIGLKTKLRASVSGYHRNWDMNGITDNRNVVQPDSTVTAQIHLHESNIWQSISGSLGATHQISERQKIQLDIDYLYYQNNNPSRYENMFTVNQTKAYQERIAVTKETPINFRVAKIDYENQLDDHWRIETGLKGSISNFVNRVSVSSYQADRWITNDKFTNQADLDEKIWAGYVSFKWTASERFDAYGGLRYEYTDTYLSTSEKQGIVDRTYGNWFPSINLTHRLSEKNSLVLAYARRLVRPVFNDIAPFVFFSGPNSFSAGNPALRPALSGSFDLSYQRNAWWLSLKYSDTRHLINMLQPEINEKTGEQIFRAQNMEYFRAWSFSSSLPLTLATWWELQSDVSVHYQTYATAYLSDNLTDNSWNVNFSGTSTFSLPRNFVVELSGNYQSKMIWGIWEFEPFGQLDIGIRKTLENDQGAITLACLDIFHTSLWQADRTLPGRQVYVRQDYDPNVRSVTLTFTRSFGNRKVKTVRAKSAAEDERLRIK